MSNIHSYEDVQNARLAAERARRAAIEARRSQLMKEITLLKDKKKNMLNYRETFMGYKAEAMGISRSVSEKIDSFPVFSAKSFNGKTANAIAEGITNSKRALGMDAESLESLIGASGEQIGKIDEYLNELNQQIAMKMAEYNGL